jgi:L-alanine-DL-glutamate epimerase-like enolase superfamily enzyme
MAPSLSVRIERWPIAGSFTISRGTKTEAAVVVAEIAGGDHRGRGECVPYARYGETLEDVADAIMAMSSDISRGLDRLGLQEAIGPGAARNALDCALWDLAAKQRGEPVHRLAGLPTPIPVTTAYTISLAAPELMAAQAEQVATRPLLKVKLGAAGDAARIAAVRSAAPHAELIVDANEGWSADVLSENVAACAEADVTLIEQPLPAGCDEVLAGMARPVRICADESVHARPSLAALRDKYDAVNIKLDKAGGLTEALAMAAEAQRLGFVVMVGSMVATSLATAPAILVAQRASVVDLDGPLLLQCDRPHGLRYDGSLVYPATAALWG